MAVTGISHKEAVERQQRMEAWSGIIGWTLYGLLGVLVIAVILVLVEGRRTENRTEELRAAWDQYYLAFKDKEKEAGPKGLANAERIPILEELWEKVKGTPVQPFVALELAQAHYQEAVDAGKDPDTGHRVRVEESFKKQAAALKKALDVFNVVRTHWPNSPAYGPLAFEGAALCNEELKDHTAAIGILEEAIKKHAKHFLADKLRYDLARNYWLRALKTEADGKNAADDREKALDHISRAVSDVGDKDVSPYSWRFQARYLRSLLEKKDEALKVFPDGKPPAPAAKPAAAVPSSPTPSDAASTTPNPTPSVEKPADNATPTPTETKPVSEPEAKPEAVPEADKKH